MEVCILGVSVRGEGLVAMVGNLGEYVDPQDFGIGQSLHAFFLGVRLMLATWEDSETVCPACLGCGCPCRPVDCGDPTCVCDGCLGWGALVDWQEALRRAGWDGPEVSQ